MALRLAILLVLPTAGYGLRSSTGKHSLSSDKIPDWMEAMGSVIMTDGAKDQLKGLATDLAKAESQEIAKTAAETAHDQFQRTMRNPLVRDTFIDSTMDSLKGDITQKADKALGGTDFSDSPVKQQVHGLIDGLANSFAGAWKKYEATEDTRIAQEKEVEEHNRRAIACGLACT
eukprot:gnl/MRDRNA2_/MRDRNA2_97239_c0_seq1.p1 gnl/MRDRNA2_/MRDRNA2_97239_c0~~gnl/MRDRNA2_/MRDRNA2_97239_c0_seq1.p1  ORF type:complete len:174 (-),score=39.06 gnl/MRDRNA2_/MRDRNA2_97239_c0_seq1:3-524(-)